MRSKHAGNGHLIRMGGTMPFNLLLLPLIGGYVFINRYHRTRFDAVRLDGYRLLLHASVAGAVLLLAAKVLVYLMCRGDFGPLAEMARHICRWWHHIIPFEHSGVALLAFVMGACGWWPMNLFTDRERAVERAALRKSDPLELYIRHALKSLKPVLITLKGGRVYMGLVFSVSTPAVPMESVRVLPFRSGYRESVERTVVFTVEYEKLILEEMEHGSEEVRVLQERRRAAREAFRNAKQQLTQQLSSLDEEERRINGKRPDRIKALLRWIGGHIARPVGAALRAFGSGGWNMMVRFGAGTRAAVVRALPSEGAAREPRFRFHIVIPVREIESVSAFDREFYAGNLDADAIRRSVGSHADVHLA